MMKTLAALVSFLFLNTLAMADSEFRHVVLLSFKEDATAEDITKIEKAFAALPDQIEAIQDFEWGTNVSPEGKAKGFTHCFLVTFKDKAGLEVYLPHQAHKDFVTILKPSLEDVLVIDYVAK
ncbi:Dabb family protein [Haloferula sp.]|uniref:Dabb family protein n=1 Tax=Haloferula sp. TaxID=2497595 RepID=UPI003C78B21D